jgi:phage-related minor tail protein
MATDDTASDGGLTQTLDTLALRQRDLEIGANSFARAMSSAFASATTSGKQFDDILKSLGLRLSDLALKMAFKPLTQALAGGFEKLLGGLAGGTSAAVTPFATGGVIAAPSYFPLGGRGVGLAGEAGPEAILPLARGADGKLGVAAGASPAAVSITVHIATPDAESFRRSETYVSGLIARAVARGQRSL